MPHLLFAGSSSVTAGEPQSSSVAKLLVRLLLHREIILLPCRALHFISHVRNLPQ
ncbi:hypothetical protein F2Q70_00010460 [Brassica cretica]|uniref:Uncharacterized protein n=1 Tax=Brassica cretica TaxID=69181 RepID=A0A8S9LQ90_BRACR|nr:hypothetical protein F2Q70_00010460 [Brassica cretica]KAF3552349.1 hypothetical protein DY000_02005169 [Brassica cretica]